MRIDVEPDLDVCGEASEIDEAIELADKVGPDVAVIDVSLKNGNGIELIKRLKERNSSVRMLVWSMYEESLYAERALRAGAMGYINKEHASDEIITAIRRVLAGEIYLSTEMSHRMLSRVVHGKDARGMSSTDTLSDRELETFTLIGRGMTTAQIAKKLQLSPKTIETHREKIKTPMLGTQDPWRHGAPALHRQDFGVAVESEDRSRFRNGRLASS